MFIIKCIRKHIVVLSGVFAILLGVSFFVRAYLPIVPQSYPSLKTDSAVDYAKEKEHWRSRIENIGERNAYQEMVREANGRSTSQAHVLAHSFGESLFEVKGVSGFVACGTQFVYGCYHQFIGSAIVALGLPVIEEFRTACAQESLSNSFSCEHGLGHGILGYFGYSMDNLKKSLAMCGPPNRDTPENGCIDGVFMEYNIHELTAYTSGKITPRTFSLDSAYSPCFEVEKKYRMQCVYELPNWWLASIVGPQDMEGVFAQAGAYCIALPDKTFTRICFEGIGHVAPALSNLNPDTAEAFCTAAGGGSSDNKESCLSAAVFRFMVEGFKDYLALCERFRLSGDDLARCRRFENRASR